MSGPDTIPYKFLLTLVIIGAALFLPAIARAQDAAFGGVEKRDEGTKVAGGEKPRDEERAATMLVSAGGGYFRALGDIGGVLDPGYSFRAFIQGREPGDPLAVGFELDFAPLKDKENAGGITYISALPSLALVFTPVSSLDIQLRAAAGLTLVRSVIARETDSVERSSLDFTVGAGAGIWKTFGGRYAVGLETQYLYYFEKTGSSSLGAYLCAGYRFD